MEAEAEVEQGIGTYFKLIDHFVKEHCGWRKGTEI